MSSQKLVEWLSWGACLGILLGLMVGLDPYRRLTMRYGYGPHRYEYLSNTLARAQELQETGAYRIRANERWLLRGGWQDDGSARLSKAFAEQRRVRLVLPVFEPALLQVRLRLESLPGEGREAVPVELEYGVNGVALGRFLVPPEGDVLKFPIETSILHRGDNIVYLYRLTRRGDPSPWLSLSWMSARILEGGHRSGGVFVETAMSFFEESALDLRIDSGPIESGAD